jgi:membrane dipeptidase
VISATRRQLLGGLAASALAGRAAAFPAAQFDRLVVIDGLGAVDNPGVAPDDIRLSPQAARQLRKSGVTAINVTASHVGNEPDSWDRTVDMIALYGRLAAANPQLLRIARSAADIDEAKRSGRVALILGTQDTSMVGADLARIDRLAGLGTRIVQLTYNLRNLSGDGALEPDNAGLSRVGRDTIARIEANRLLLDLSHGGQRTIAEAIKAATRPLTISHTGCRSLHDNPRNVWDAELKALAEKGGVIGIYWMPFLAANSRATTADLVRHMRHAVNVCGEDHVAIGTDNILGKTVIDDEARKRQKAFFEDRKARGIAAPGEGADIFNIVAELDSHLRFRLLADALEADGWPATRIEKVMGANLLRLYRDTWGS